LKKIVSFYFITNREKREKKDLIHQIKPFL